MVPFIPKPPITGRQKAAALAVAGLADALQLIIMPLTVEGAASPVEDVIDFITAVTLMIICGFKWQFILAFLMELIPGFDLFPTWTAVILLMPTNNSPAQVIQPPIQNQPPQSALRPAISHPAKAPPIQLPS